MSVIGIIEAILFVAGEPVSCEALADTLEIPLIELYAHVERMQQEYTEKNRGVRLMRLNDSLQLKTNEAYAEYIQRIFQPPQRQNLSQSALETLSIIAYRQPITKTEIAAIRGVKADHSVQMLLQKRLICQVGRKETLGRPVLYGTTQEFLRHFDISDLSMLPSLEELGGSDEVDGKTQELSD
ncbi:MAG: SMC-Scp complex subunit ScpB [Christensenellales bacterium]